MFKCENYNAQKPAECTEYVSSSHAMHFEIIKSEVDYSYIQCFRAQFTCMDAK